jgi:predicted nuclease with TOPRIM domain
LSELVPLYEEIEDDAWSYLKLYKLAKSSGMSNEQIVRAVDTVLNKLPSAVENYFQTQRRVNDLIEMEQDLSGHVEVLRGEKSLLIHEISDLKVQEHNLVEGSNRKKGEIEELQKEQQQIENTMNKYQHMVICKFAGAIHIVLDTFAMKLTRAIEIREMYKGDIAE